MLLWISHGTYEWVMVRYVWVIACMNASWYVWVSHGTYKWVMSRMNESCYTHTLIMLCMNESWHICMNHVIWMNRSRHTDASVTSHVCVISCTCMWHLMCSDDRVTLGHLTRCAYDCMYVLRVRSRTYCGNTTRMNEQYKHVTRYIRTTICGIFINCHLLHITRGLSKKMPICVERVCKRDLMIWNPLNLVYHIYHIHERAIPYSYAWLTHVSRIWIIIYTTFEWYLTHIWMEFDACLMHLNYVHIDAYLTHWNYKYNSCRFDASESSNLTHFHDGVTGVRVTRYT